MDEPTNDELRAAARDAYGVVAASVLEGSDAAQAAVERCERPDLALFCAACVAGGLLSGMAAAAGRPLDELLAETLDEQQAALDKLLPAQEG